MQQRYYDPIAGRFLSVDPIVTDANTGKGFGLYTYVDNNPYSKIDPDGRAPGDPNPVYCLSGFCSGDSGNGGGDARGNRLDPMKLEGFKPYAQAMGEVLQEGLEWYLLALSVATGLGETRAAVWALKPLERGVAIENALGRNLPGNFPVIDRFANGIATSIKSLDLGAKTYQSLSTLSRTVTGYVDKVASFAGRTWGGASVKGAEIQGRALELAIPMGGGSPAQHAALQAVVKYAQSVGVRVTIVPF